MPAAAPQSKGHDVPDRSELSSRGQRATPLIAAAVFLGLLSSCATTKKAEADGASAELAAAADPSKPAQGAGQIAGQPGAAGSKPGYVDPVVSAQPHQGIRINPKLPKITRSTAPAPQLAGTDQPPAMQQGLITQPTGVRAGSFSIFSSQPAAVTGAAASASSKGGATGQAGQGLAPINGSVYTPRTPLAPQQADIPTIPAGAVIAAPSAGAGQTAGQAAKPPAARKPTPADRLQVKATSVCVNDSRGRPINC